GKLIFVGLARSLENGKRMLREHQHFGGRFRLKDDEHDRNSHDGHIPTLTEHPAAAKTEDETSTPAFMPCHSHSCCPHSPRVTARAGGRPAFAKAPPG